jgi:hypothetical protein
MKNKLGIAAFVLALLPCVGFGAGFLCSGMRFG